MELSLIPKNWKTFQHYRDRRPTWIKLHRGLLDDYEFSRLPVESRAMAPMLWLIASEDVDGILRFDSEALAFRLHVDSAVLLRTLKPLIDKGFFIDASGLLADCYQDASPETETETEKNTSPSAQLKIRKAKPDISEKAEPFFREVWESWPKTNPSGEKAHRGPRAAGQRAFQKILDTEQVTPLELKFCGMLYAKADTLPEHERILICNTWEYRDKAVMHISTFYGPEKRPYREFLPIARNIIAARMQGVSNG